MKIGFLCGSLRAGSINKKLEAALMMRAQELAAEMGIKLTATIIDLADYEMPIFHGDMSAPDSVHGLIARMADCDAIIITSPEYNGSLPPLLKNVIDWTSTISKDHLSGPIYGIAASSPGPMSGIMGMRQIAYILTRLGAEVVPVQVGCGHAANAFMDDGCFVAGNTAKLADKMLESLILRVRQKSAYNAAG